PLVLVMVGLPARGKTYIARKLARYLSWLGVPARVFNVGNYRRRHLGSTQPAAFFDPDNPDGVSARRRMALAALDDLIAWLGAGQGLVAIYDATNVTAERRALVRGHLAAHGHSAVFIECVCNDPALVEANVRESKVSMPDYANMEPDRAVQDFRARIGHYERAYVPVGLEEGAFVRLIDVGEQVILHRIQGSLASRIVFFLMNLHIVPRPILLMRHGESELNAQGRIGGDAGLTPRGRAFSRALVAHLEQRFPGPPPTLWTSTLRRTIETISGLSWPSRALRNLDEIDAGVCDGWTYEEIAEKMPEEFAARRDDKLHYRYPRGESYEDVIERLDPVLVELERQRDPVVIVAHQAVLRCLYGYFTDQAPEACPHLDVPLHTVIELIPRAYGVAERRTVLLPPAQTSEPPPGPPTP
ncbi:MAG TPA: fructose-2,6-bisphosphatase, partial [Deltaproteobacteria bacterium]|nr:fructose-2,6-bisphosphatase [Deltaproteobacteria bacterium]